MLFDGEYRPTEVSDLESICCNRGRACWMRLMVKMKGSALIMVYIRSKSDWVTELECSGRSFRDLEWADCCWWYRQTMPLTEPRHLIEKHTGFSITDYLDPRKRWSLRFSCNSRHVWPFYNRLKSRGLDFVKITWAVRQVGWIVSLF